MSQDMESAGSAGRAIITFSRGWQTLVATRSLGRRGVQVITGDEYRMTAASFSRYSSAEFRYPNPTKEPEAFLDALEKTVIEHKPDILGLSALLTVTMVKMGEIIDVLKAKGIREKVKVIVGGTPVTSDFARKIGADFRAYNAVEGVNKCVEWLVKKGKTGDSK